MKQHPSVARRVLCASLIAGQISIAIPAAAQVERSDGSPATDEVVVNRTPPLEWSLPAVPKFSLLPTDAEIFEARVFEEPLVPTSDQKSLGENRALSTVLLKLAGSSEDLAPIVQFLDDHPASRWRVSLLTNLGLRYRQQGFINRALQAWERAWLAGKDSPEPEVQALTDRALAELADLNSRLGRFDRLDRLLTEAKGRHIGGSPAEKLQGAREGLWTMRQHPEVAFRCGPLALDRIRLFTSKQNTAEPKIRAAESTARGTSLSQIAALAESIGMPMQMAFRSPGAPVISPAVVHWKAGHFAALLEQQGDRYRFQDPTFGGEYSVLPAAFDEETSGYFLVGQGALPRGWRAVPPEEATAVWGKGFTSVNNPEATKQCSNSSGGGCPGGSCQSTPMASYRVHTMTVNLNISDTPISYSPPRGPAIQFRVTYNHRDVFQPATFTYSNLGPKWTFDWMSYVEDIPSSPTANITNVYLRGGGREHYPGFVSASAPHRESRAVLVRTSTSPIRYERTMPDGSVEVFSQDGGGSPRKVFLTDIRGPETDPASPQATSLHLSYQGATLVGITDALGQVTTIDYVPGTYRISRVTDPFGRSAMFEYTPGTAKLRRITDPIGITSEFGYGEGDFITTLTTPYGTTLFARHEIEAWDVYGSKWIEATDPLGGKERFEFRQAAPNIEDHAPPETVPAGFGFSNVNMHARNSFYWDKRATALYPGDYTKAHITHWLHDDGEGVAADVKESEKAPLENRVWYRYPGQADALDVGSHAVPSVIARVLDDGTIQAYQYQYNTKGNVTKATDPLGREKVYEYDAADIDLLKVKQKNSASPGGYDVLQSSTYNSQHQPLTITDASGRTTTYTYNATGQVLTVTTPPRAGINENRTTTYSYDNDAYPLSVTGPATGTTTSYTQDSYGRLRTIVDSDSYVITLDYDALDRLRRATYPDGTYDETVYNRLDPERRRDRLGRWRETFYDALRRPVALRDALGRATTLQWCNCGSLEKFIDSNNNTTTWERDIQGRITRTIRPDGTDAIFTYETTTSRLKEFRDPRQQVIGLRYFMDDDWKQVTYGNTQQPTPNVTFAYDQTYDRLVSISDGTGTSTYLYNPITATPNLGAARLQTAAVPVGGATAMIAYGYDELGRVVSRSIDGVTQSWTYDVLGRVGTELNALGSFSYTYDGTTDRLTTLTYPNGQTAAFTYLGNLQDRRLQDIHNKRPGGATLSRFQYTYDAHGVTKTWTQQADSGPAKRYELGHDSVDELLTATLTTTDPTPVTLKRYRYAYDKTENRSSEQIDDAATAATHNVINAVTSLLPGGTIRLAGTVNEPATVTVQGKPASVASDNRFEGSASVASGTSTVAVVATDPSGNTRTNTYQLTESGTTKTLASDANGNLISDGTRIFEWDGVNRVTAVAQGTNRTEFTYDGWGHRVRILEKSGSVVTSDHRFVWCGSSLAEERDGSGGVTRRFFSRGMQESGIALFYASDHLGSIRELTDYTGAVRARYDYDPFGRMTKVSGDKDSVFGFAGTVAHPASSMSLARFRAYDSGLGRWISPDPIGFLGGLNLYGYVQGQPMDQTDPLGLQSPGAQPPTEPPPGGWGPWLTAAEESATAAVEAAGVAAGTLAAGCLVILAAVCQTGDGRPAVDPQTGPASPRTDPASPQTPPVTPPTTQPPTNAGSKQSNYIVDIVKGKCSNSKAMCDMLEAMLIEAKAAGNKKLIQDIIQAEKFLGCRNIRKRKGQ